MQVWIILLLLLSTTWARDVRDFFPKYGYYCGKGHTDRYGREPLDRLDQACRIHDTCTGALGLLNCYCSSQLVWSTMNVNPGDYGSTLYKARDSILFWMYQADRFCSNDLHSFDKYYAISGISHESQDKYGFQYHVGHAKYYYGTTTMTYLEFNPTQYRSFANAVASSHNLTEFLQNIAQIDYLNATNLAPRTQYEFIETDNIVVLLNADLNANFFYYANEPKFGYIPDYTKEQLKYTI